MAYVFNPLSGEFDVVIKDGFLPYKIIPLGASVTIDTNRQAFISEGIEIYGELTVNGDLVLDV